MFQYVRSVFASTFDHPIAASMFVVAVLFAIVGAVFQFGTIPAIGRPSGMVAGFIGIYAVFFLMIGVVGYLALYVMKYISVARGRFGPTS